MKSITNGQENRGEYRKIFERYLPAGRPANFLEIGVYKAGFTKFIKHLGLPLASYVGVDPYSGGADDPYVNTYWRLDNVEEVYNSTKQYYDSIGATLIRARSDDFFASNTKKFDFIYVDGDHRQQTAYSDMLSSKQILSRGGLMMINDYANVDCPGVTPAVNQFLHECNDEIEEIGYHRIEFCNGNKIIPVNLIDIFLKFKN
ncbi:class I SAM-dependent methyltransferase [Desulfovibrio sp. OttesenSCG-928-C06]|nr:class I SAM-dependent methyltransferase [Desulfovibrio sp. OttesenSCG-928-C06]